MSTLASTTVPFPFYQKVIPKSGVSFLECFLDYKDENLIIMTLIAIQKKQLC